MFWLFCIVCLFLSYRSFSFNFATISSRGDAYSSSSSIGSSREQGIFIYFSFYVNIYYLGQQPKRSRSELIFSVTYTSVFCFLHEFWFFSD